MQPVLPEYSGGDMGTQATPIPAWWPFQTLLWKGPSQECWVPSHSPATYMEGCRKRPPQKDWGASCQGRLLSSGEAGAQVGIGRELQDPASIPPTGLWVPTGVPAGPGLHHHSMHRRLTAVGLSSSSKRLGVPELACAPLFPKDME